VILDAWRRRNHCRGITCGSFQNVEHRLRNFGRAGTASSQDGQRVGTSRRVGNRRPRGNDVERIADNVRNDQGQRMPRAAGPRQVASLDARQPLADGIQFIDRRPRAHQETSHGLLVGESQSCNRRRKESTPSPGNQDQAQIISVQFGNNFENTFRSEHPFSRRFVDPRRTGGMEHDLPQRANAVSGNVDPADDFAINDIVSQDYFHGGRHAGSSLPRPDDGNFSEHGVGFR
jgi:hypothetical protein